MAEQQQAQNLLDDAPCRRRDSCRLCGSTDVECVVPFERIPISEALVAPEKVGQAQAMYPLDLFLCRSCGHVQLLDVIDPEFLFRDYEYKTSDSLGLVEHFRTYADQIVDRFERAEGDLVVEIGSNDGSLLRAFQDRGLQVLGVDPAREIAEQATRQGTETLATFFDDDVARKIRTERGAADLMAANNVFAHSDDLGSMAEGVQTLLADDGVFVFEVGYLADIVDQLMFDVIYHEHLCYHSVQPLKSFLERHGLELFDVERIPTKGGSIRCFAQQEEGPRGITERVDELLEMEQRSNLAEPETFHRFAEELDDRKQTLHRTLDELRGPGVDIAAYGMSATVNTLVHHFELGEYIDFYVDDNPRKQGMYSPGHQIPITDPKTLYDREDVHVLVSAWQYADPIMSKHRSLSEQGSSFIIPLPTVEVVG